MKQENFEFFKEVFTPSKKVIKKLDKLANNLENANYHSECAVITHLKDEYETGKLVTSDDVLNWLCSNPEWKGI